MGRSRSLVKGLASVVQLVFSSITLYEARGSQLQRYGYAAFGLSVFPYTLMTFVNLVVGTIVGEYSTLFVLRTVISDEAKRCGGTISGEIGTLPEVTPGQSANAVESPVEEDHGLNAIFAIFLYIRHFILSKFPEVDAKTTKTGTPHKVIRSVGAGGVGKDGSEVSEDPVVFPSGEPLTAAYLRVEDGGVLVITMKGRTGRFQLIESGDAIDDDPLTTFHFHVSAVTNQEKVQKRLGEDLAEIVSFFHSFINLILMILPYVFIFLLTGFRKGDSTEAQRGWMMSWLVFNQVFSLCGFLFSINHIDIGGPMQAALCIMIILLYSIPAIGGFVVVGRMLLEFGTCSIS